MKMRDIFSFHNQGSGVIKDTDKPTTNGKIYKIIGVALMAFGVLTFFVTIVKGGYMFFLLGLIFFLYGISEKHHLKKEQEYEKEHPGTIVKPEKNQVISRTVDDQAHKARKSK